MFCVEGLPNSVSRLANSVPLNQFPGHRRQHVVVFVDVLQAFTSELALHGQCDQELLPHKAQTGRLHGALVAKKLHSHRPPLADPPRPPTSLPQAVQRISRLIEKDGREVQEIETRFNQLGMGNYDLYSLLDLPCVPGLSLRGIHARPQNR